MHSVPLHTFTVQLRPFLGGGGGGGNMCLSEKCACSSQLPCCPIKQVASLLDKNPTGVHARRRHEPKAGGMGLSSKLNSGYQKRQVCILTLFEVVCYSLCIFIINRQLSFVPRQL